MPVLRRDAAATFVDLGMSPLCETYPAASDFRKGEVYYPLHVYTCDRCYLVQLEEYEKAENIFTDYPYFSSYLGFLAGALRELLRNHGQAVRPQPAELCRRNREQ